MNKLLFTKYLLFIDVKPLKFTHELLEVCISSAIILIFMAVIISCVHKRRNKKWKRFYFY